MLYHIPYKRREGAWVGGARSHIWGGGEKREREREKGI